MSALFADCVLNFNRAMLSTVDRKKDRMRRYLSGKRGPTQLLLTTIAVGFCCFSARIGQVHDSVLCNKVNMYLTAKDAKSSGVKVLQALILLVNSATQVALGDVEAIAGTH